jgi:diguanylate cyclase (GGDEF)-like protein/PAS domain S-box-containing protein
MTSVHSDEERRLQALDSYNILDTESEEDFDELAKLAAYICDVPIALVSLVAKDRQWFKAHVGLNICETPRELSFCAHAIRSPKDIMEVPDATQDARFANNPLVTDDPKIRFYAGSPLVTPEGFALGTLCVIDRVPRHLSDKQKEMLALLAHQAVAQLQLRARVQELNETTARCERVAYALRDSEERFQLFMSNTPILAFMKDDAGKYVYVNEAVLKRFELQHEDIIGKSDAEFWPQAAEEIRAHDQQVMEGGGTVRFEEAVPMADGQTSHWLSYKFPLTDSEGRRLLAGTSLDITDRKYYEQQMAEYQSRLEQAVTQLEEMALTDSLTGLRNKASFEARIDEEISRARRYLLPLSLLMIDIDHFKKINDDFGHPVGDEVLERIADILREGARPSDFIARYGGEEFVLILPNTDAQGAYYVAERMRETVEAAIPQPRGLTISAGVASLTPGESGRSLLERADEALYRAKNAGRNRVSVAESAVPDTSDFSFDE